MYITSWNWKWKKKMISILSSIIYNKVFTEIKIVAYSLHSLFKNSIKLKKTVLLDVSMAFRHSSSNIYKVSRFLKQMKNFWLLLNAVLRILIQWAMCIFRKIYVSYSMEEENFFHCLNGCICMLFHWSF